MTSDKSRSRRTAACQVCGGTKPLRELLSASLVRDNVAALIASKMPAWSAESVICTSCLNR